MADKSQKKNKEARKPKKDKDSGKKSVQPMTVVDTVSQKEKK